MLSILPEIHFPILSSSPRNTQPTPSHTSSYLSSTCLKLINLQILSLRILNHLKAAPVLHPRNSRKWVGTKSHFLLLFALLIQIQLAAKAQEKAARKAATQEKAQARKAKQAKTKAKAAERERRQNQENICKLCFSSILLLLLRNIHLALDTRQWSEDDLHQPAPQDATVSRHQLYFSMLAHFHCHIVQCVRCIYRY